MDNLSTTSAMVHEILVNEPASRNSDNLLYYLICKMLLAEQGENIDTIGFGKLFLSLKGYGLPQFETVGRCRRKLQQEFPELQGLEKIRSGRMNLCENFKEFAMEGQI